MTETNQPQQPHGSPLMQVEMASLRWQEVINENQQVTAFTVQKAATDLMTLYQDAQAALDWLMHPQGKYDPDKYKPGTMGKPIYQGDSDKQYSNNVNIWETYYNEQNQNWQNAENSLNTPVQAMDQQESSLGNASQEASQIAGVVAEPNKIVVNLLQNSL